MIQIPLVIESGKDSDPRDLSYFSANCTNTLWILLLFCHYSTDSSTHKQPDRTKIVLFSIRTSIRSMQRNPFLLSMKKWFLLIAQAQTTNTEGEWNSRAEICKKRLNKKQWRHRWRRRQWHQDGGLRMEPRRSWTRLWFGFLSLWGCCLCKRSRPSFWNPYRERFHLLAAATPWS